MDMFGAPGIAPEATFGNQGAEDPLMEFSEPKNAPVPGFGAGKSLESLDHAHKKGTTSPLIFEAFKGRKIICLCACIYTHIHAQM